MLSVLTFTLPHAVFAATTGTTNASVEIEPGDLFIASPSPTVNFGKLIKDGTVQSIPATLGVMKAGDYSGLNAGWNITASATQFTQMGGAGVQLPISSLLFGGVDIVTQTKGSSILPTPSGAGLPMDGSSLKILSANIGEGVGEFDIAFDTEALLLEIDMASVVLDTGLPSTVYESVITWAITTGP